jgi:hypothetical protein
MIDACQIAGEFILEAFDCHGNKKWEERFHNGTTTAGVNNMLSVQFASGTQSTSWFIGLINNASFTALAASDTIASHPGWVELTSYTEATRPAWSPGSPSGGSIANSSTVNFTINATVAIKGAFLVNQSTKGGTTGLMYATGAFDSVQNLVNADILKVTYTITITPS